MSPTNESNSFKLHQIDLSTIKSDKLGDVLTKMALNDLNCPCTLCQINAKISQVCTQATENAINQCKNSTDIKNTNVLNSTIDQSKDTENLDKIMLSKEESSDENVKGIKGTQVESTVNQNERYFPQCTDASVKCSTSVKVKVKKRNKAKSSPLKKVNKPKQMTRPRKEETPEERQKRLEKQRLKYRELREKETPEKRTKRLDKIRQYRKKNKKMATINMGKSLESSNVDKLCRECNDLVTRPWPRDLIKPDLIVECIDSDVDKHYHLAHTFPLYVLSVYFQKAILFANRNKRPFIDMKRLKLPFRCSIVRELINFAYDGTFSPNQINEKNFAEFQSVADYTISLRMSRYLLSIKKVIFPNVEEKIKLTVNLNLNLNRTDLKCMDEKTFLLKCARDDEIEQQEQILWLKRMEKTST